MSIDVITSCDAAWAIVVPGAVSGDFASPANFLLTDSLLDGSSVRAMDVQVGLRCIIVLVFVKCNCGASCCDIVWLKNMV